MIEITNVGKVIAQIEVWEKAVQALVTETARGLTVDIFKHVIEISPQYSGDFAGNWKYKLNGVDTDFDPALFNILGQGNEPFRLAGHPEAVAHAMSANAGRDSAFKLGDTAFFSNSADHTEPYSMKIWEGTIQFRPGNAKIDERTENYMRSYSVISAATAKRLRMERLA
jgi:hypothetical protein